MHRSISEGVSAIHVNNDAAPDMPTHDVLRGVWNFRESNDAANTVQGCCIQIARKPVPSGLSQFPRRHDAINTEQRYAPQDERGNTGREIHTLSKSARSNESAVTCLGASIRQSMAANRVDHSRPPLFLQRLAWLSKLVAINDITCTKCLEVVTLTRLARGRHDLKSSASEQGDRDTPDTAGGAGYQHIALVKIGRA